MHINHGGQGAAEGGAVGWLHQPGGQQLEEGGESGNDSDFVLDSASSDEEGTSATPRRRSPRSARGRTPKHARRAPADTPHAAPDRAALSDRAAALSIAFAASALTTRSWTTFFPARRSWVMGRQGVLWGGR